MNPIVFQEDRPAYFLKTNSTTTFGLEEPKDSISEVKHEAAFISCVVIGSLFFLACFALFFLTVFYMNQILFLHRYGYLLSLLCFLNTVLYVSSSLLFKTGVNKNTFAAICCIIVSILLSSLTLIFCSYEYKLLIDLIINTEEKLTFQQVSEIDGSLVKLSETEDKEEVPLVKTNEGKEVRTTGYGTLIVYNEETKNFTVIKKATLDTLSLLFVIILTTCLHGALSVLSFVISTYLLATNTKDEESEVLQLLNN